MIAILILAAGQSSRMRGIDKLTELIDGVPLLGLQAERALATGAAVFVALPAADHPRAKLLHGLEITPIFVPDAAQGMGVTLRESVASLPVCEAFLVVLADLVALQTDDLNAVIAAKDTYPDFDIWRGATQTGKPGHPILFSNALRPEFAHLSGDKGAAPIVKNAKSRVHHVPLPNNRALLDLDTPEGWAAWRRGK